MPSSDFILRSYQPSDFEALYEMDQVCFSQGVAYGREELRTYLRSENTLCVVAESAGTVAGFILTECSDGLGHIITIDVLESYRLQSIGSQLLQAAEWEAAARGVTSMYLETATSNKAAIALWKKHGYRETGLIENYYGRGLDAFEMQKFLRRLPEDS